MSTATGASLHRHCSLQLQIGEIRDVEQMSFQMGPEDIHGGYDDRLPQSSTVVRRVLCWSVDQRQVAA